MGRRQAATVLAPIAMAAQLLSACAGPPSYVSTLVNGKKLAFAQKQAEPEVEARTGWQAWDLAAAPDGSLYIADTLHHRILRLAPTGLLDVAAGEDTEDDADGPAAEARFKLPHGISWSSRGLLIADAGNRKIKRLEQGRVSTELVSTPLERPVAVAEDRQGRLLVADAGSGRILRKQPQRAPETLLQLEPHRLLQDMFLDPVDLIHYSDNLGLWRLDGRRRQLLAAGEAFVRLSGLAFWPGGQLLSDAYRHRLLMAGPDAPPTALEISLPKGDPALRFPGAITAALSEAAPKDGPADGATGASGDTLYLAEPDAGRIRRLSRREGKWSAEILVRSGTQGFGIRRDGEDLGMPHALLYDKLRKLVLVCDYFNQRLLQIDAAGAATPWLEKKGLNLPAGLAQDESGRIYVAAQHRIHVIEPDGKLRLLAGDGSAGLRDGKGDKARFWLPRGLALEPDGSLIVADHGNHAIRRVSPSGEVSTLAGNGEPGFRNANGSEARFQHPSDVLRLPDGQLLVADSWNHQIRQISPDGRVSSFAGGSGPGLRDAWRSKAQFYLPSALARDAGGSLYVADSWNHRIRRILPSGEVRTLAGAGYLLGWNGGSNDGAGDAAQFNQPMGLGFDPAGRLLVADTGNHRVRVVTGFNP